MSPLPAADLLQHRLIRDGHWLFRHRGVLPLLLLVPLVWSAVHWQWLGGSRVIQNRWNWCCTLISLAGILLRVTTVGFVPQGTSGRNTRGQLAASLNTSGWYSVCRNPLYLGNFLVGLGILLTMHDPLLILLYAAAFWLYYERIISAEEEFLADKFGDAYRSWARATPAFLPAWRQWQSPELPFCWRTVLRREHSSLLLVGVSYFLIAAAQAGVATGRIIPGWDWTVLLVVSAAAFLLLRWLKKRTRLLQVVGR